MWQNDAFANSDNQFTNGVSLRLNSALAPRLEDTTGTLAIGRSLAAFLLPDESSLHYRETWAIGQNLQTPDNIALEEIILNDVPYVGMLAVSNAFAAFDNERFTAAGILLGWTGKAAVGEATQSAVHELTGSRDPKGWDHQLDFEPLINLYFSGKRRLWQLPGFSGSLTGDVAVGNFFTFGQAGVDVRLGNAPDGFLSQPAPIGRGLDIDASLRRPGARYTYLSLAARTTGIAHALPRDGNLFRNDNEWTENNTVDPKRWVHQLLIGLHHERPRWGVHLHFWYSGDTVKDDDRLFPTEDPQNNFGTVTFELRPQG